jgi:hypothetical protein
MMKFIFAKNERIVLIFVRIMGFILGYYNSAICFGGGARSERMEYGIS